MLVDDDDRSSVPTNEAQFCAYAITLLYNTPGFEFVSTSVGEKITGIDPRKGAPKTADGALVFEYENNPLLIVIEAKFGRSTAVAIRQIEDNGYVCRVRKYLEKKCGLTVDDSCVYLLGMNMDYPAPNYPPEVQLKCKRFKL